ncbi:MAG: hypothetical protein RLZZ621_1202 [Gemmatimonadota bacterium]
MKILIVDDEPFVIRLLSHQLDRLGFTDVTAHEHPRTALEALESGAITPHMILLDLQMPEIDGIEFVRHLTRLNYRGGLILVSGEDERILRTARRLAEAHRLDIRGALHKPVTPAALSELLGKPANTPFKTGSTPILNKAIRKTYDGPQILRAIEDGEFVNVYQPKVRFSDGQLVGVETLVRWQHPEDGLVFPDQFITEAEDKGLINELTRVILEQALEQAYRWRVDGLELHVSVNISMDSLSSLDFPDYLARVVEERKVPARQLVLEVTESRLMKDALVALDVCSRLRLKHIGLSIDDFGTGHSSLAQLRDIPFDELKVDRQFVHNARRDPVSRAILEGSLAMSKQLGMHSVAEGVEDEDDWALLRELGCDIAQGYFVSKPMFPHALTRWIEEWEGRRAALVDR